jgi:hypothetical protein
MLPPPPGLATGLERDRTNQPGPIFPQFPGIILELPAGLLASSAGPRRTRMTGIRMAREPYEGCSGSAVRFGWRRRQNQSVSDRHSEVQVLRR